MGGDHDEFADEYTLGICVTGKFSSLEAADKAAEDHAEELVERFSYTNPQTGATPSQDGMTMLDDPEDPDGP